VWQGATSPNGAVNKGTLIYGLFAGSQPEFSWGTIFIFLFFVVLGVAPGPLGRISPLTEPPDPVSGMIVVDSLIAGRADLLLESLWYLSLPVLTLSFVLTGPIIKMVRENVSQSMSLGFIQYGEAVGLSKKMLASDSLLAAVAPTLTLIGILFSFMLGGAVLIESMFSINGLGQFSLQSVLAMDYPAIQGVVIVISSLTLLVYLLLDVAQALLDPRLRS
jgi:ABC-type dipeptide/oligopeptide/nickel transport system permease component